MKNAAMIVIPSFVTYLIGIRWEFFVIWIIIVIFDVISGVVTSRYNNAWKSSIMKKGLLGKCNETILIFTVILCQRIAQLNGINVPPVFEILMVGFCYKELGSIIENVKKTGRNVPEILLKIFKITNNYNNEKNKKNNNGDDKED